MTTPPFPLTMPATPQVELMDWGVENNGLESQSGITGATQFGATAFALWNFDFALPRMEWDDAGPWASFFAQLRGTTGTFKFPIPGVDAPRSGYSGAVGVVDGASQLGYTLDTKSWDNNETDFLSVGDFFTVNDELKVVRVAPDSDGTGLSTITFDPALRTSPDDLAVIKINNPYVVLASLQRLPKLTTGAPQLTKLKLKCQERPAST